MEWVLTTRLKELLEREPHDLLAAYLYGSRARGEGHPDSDVDIGLLYRNRPPRTLDSTPRRLEDALERELGQVVEVVVLNDAPPDLVHRVVRDGVLLLDRDRSRRLAFEVHSLNQFFDMQPIWDLYRRKGATA